MARLYLIRHAQPLFPGGKKYCLGAADFPLSPLGTLQAALLGEYMKQKPPLAAVWSSDLLRARETAQRICRSVRVCEDLREMHAGDWDGLCFDEIRSRWPEVYEKRGADPGYPIPGAEPAEQGQRRFRGAVEQILKQCPGDVAIVAHATVIQSFLSFVLGTDVRKCREYRLDYTGICTLEYAGGQFSLLRINERPALPMTPRLCRLLLETAESPADHCREVAEKANAITQALLAAGITCDTELVCHGALLHDLARKERDHPAVGSQWLEELGYPDIARIVSTHHDPETEDICEETIVFLANKLPLEQRFAASFSKCQTPEARAAHQRRYQRALVLREKINALCGKEIVP